jgi:tetratricopeptide (TPR) repeat protein
MSPEQQKALEHYEKAAAAHRAGDPATALAQYNDCLAALRSVNDRLSQGRVWALVGEIHAAAGEHAKAMGSFELAALLLDGHQTRRERALMLFKLAEAAHVIGQFERAVEAYDDIIRFTQDSGDGRMDGLVRLLRGQLIFEHGSERAGLEQIITGSIRLSLLHAPDAKRAVEVAREFGARVPGKLYQELVENICERRDLRRAFLRQDA